MLLSLPLHKLVHMEYCCYCRQDVLEGQHWGGVSGIPKVHTTWYKVKWASDVGRTYADIMVT